LLTFGLFSVDPPGKFSANALADVALNFDWEGPKIKKILWR